ncbi:MAG: hypothetical protein E6Q99_01015 [Elusimicrobia bacterium]|nr:MAG: hypothetical protein E6Q99_01015 [Elusimicrobiota bacterium]
MTSRAEAPHRPVDIALLSWTAGLTVFGWLVLYSASALLGDSRHGDQYFFLKRQMIWTALGLVGMGVAALTPLTWVQRMARPILFATVVLLALVLVAGHEVGGAKRWLRVGGLGVQPSEFAKLAVVLVLADYLDRRQSRLTRWSGFLPPLLVTGFVLGLILLERDLGTPFLIGCVALSLIALAGAKWGISSWWGPPYCRGSSSPCRCPTGVSVSWLSWIPGRNPRAWAINWCSR